MNTTTLTPAEAAERLHVSVWTVRRWVRRGSLPAARLGTAPSALMRIRAEDVDRLLTPIKRSA